MRQAAKRDGNEKSIIQALEAVGAQVVRLSAEGIPDLLVAYRGRNILLEVKDKHGTLTPEQVKFHSSWQAPIFIVKSPEDAVKAIGAHIPIAKDGNEHMTPQEYKDYMLRQRAGLSARG